MSIETLERNLQVSLKDVITRKETAAQAVERLLDPEKSANWFRRGMTAMRYEIAARAGLTLPIEVSNSKESIPLSKFIAQVVRNLRNLSTQIEDQLKSPETKRKVSLKDEENHANFFVVNWLDQVYQLLAQYEAATAPKRVSASSVDNKTFVTTTAAPEKRRLGFGKRALRAAMVGVFSATAMFGAGAASTAEASDGDSNNEGNSHLLVEDPNQIIDIEQLPAVMAAVVDSLTIIANDESLPASVRENAQELLQMAEAEASLIEKANPTGASTQALAEVPLSAEEDQTFKEWNADSLSPDSQNYSVQLQVRPSPTDSDTSLELYTVNEPEKLGNLLNLPETQVADGTFEAIRQLISDADLAAEINVALEAGDTVRIVVAVDHDTTNITIETTLSNERTLMLIDPEGVPQQVTLPANSRVETFFLGFDAVTNEPIIDKMALTDQEEQMGIFRVQSAEDPVARILVELGFDINFESGGGSIGLGIVPQGESFIITRILTDRGVYHIVYSDAGMEAIPPTAIPPTAVPTSEAPLSVSSMLALSTEVPQNFDGGVLMVAYVVESGNEGLSSYTPVDWMSVATTNPENLRNVTLAPELQEALATGEYVMLGYLSDGETGEFIAVPIVVNLEGGPIRQARLTREGVDYYYYVNTPETPGIYQNIILPSLEAMRQSSIYRDAMTYTPQIVINFYDYQERDSMEGEDIVVQGSAFIKGAYHPETNVIVVNIAIEPNMSWFGGDMLQLIEIGVTGAFAGQRVQTVYNWDAPANPDQADPTIGHSVIAFNTEVLTLTTLVGDNYRPTYSLTEDELHPPSDFMPGESYPTSISN